MSYERVGDPMKSAKIRSSAGSTAGPGVPTTPASLPKRRSRNDCGLPISDCGLRIWECGLPIQRFPVRKKKSAIRNPQFSEPAFFAEVDQHADRDRQHQPEGEGISPLPVELRHVPGRALRIEVHAVNAGDER